MNVRTVDRLAEVSRVGSPTLLHAFGRLFGLAQAERNALGRTGLPRWAVLGLGVTLGGVLGAAAHRRWPRQTERLMGG